MANLEQFGSYLLLKKLGEDSLGETFRAGCIGSQGVQQVVLLRVFNGRNVNGARLWEKVAGRRAIQEQLKGPNIGDGIDLGEVRGIPYAAYDYISGKSLTQLLVQASKEAEPIPLDHALLVAERVSAALATAHEMRVDGGKVVHGFVVPHMVMISNEGESRLLGFEVAPGLLDLAGGGAFGAEVTRYLAPEAVADGTVDKADDGFSLGVLLYELATCRPLPEPGGDGYGPILASAQIPGEGTPMPAPVTELIGKSLGPRAGRPADVVAWHRALSQVMAEGGYDATAFNLAFFMHNLFRSEIEAETREIAVEKTLEIPASTMAAIRGDAAPPDAAETTPVTAEVEPATAPHPVAGYTPPPPPQPAAEAATTKSKTGLWIALAAALLLLAGVGGGAWWWLNRTPAATEETAAVIQPPEPIPLVTETGEPGADDLLEGEGEPAEPEGPTPEEIQAQIAQMIDSRSEQMEARFRQQYDERIRALQAELEQAQTEAEAREAALAAREEELALAAAEAEEVEAETSPPPAETGAGANASAGDGTSPSGRPAATGATAGDPAASLEATASAAPVEEEPEPPPEPPAKPRVRLGDLVSYGPGVTPPDLIDMPDPRYPPMARRLGKEATIEVRLLVDETGKVVRSETVGTKAGYGFEESALDASRRSRYQPATKDGVRVKMWTSVKLRFENP